MKLKHLNLLLILILLIGLTNLAVNQELRLNLENQLATKQMAHPNINEQLPIVQTKTEQTKSNHALPSEIKVGGVFPIVKRPEAGRDRRDAFLIAIYEINNQTGVDRILPEGVTLIPLVEDDDNSAAGGTAAAQTLIAKGVDIVIGSSGSSVSAAMAAELGPQKIPQISYASPSPALSDRTTYPYFMRNVASDADQAKAIVDLVQAFKWINGATICTDDSYGTNLITYFTNEFLALGGTIITAQQFSPGATDVSSQVQAIKDATGVEFVLANMIDKDGQTLFKKAKELGLTEGGAAAVPWIITDGTTTTSTIEGEPTVQAAMHKFIGTSLTQMTGPGYAAFNATWFDSAWNWLEGPAVSQVTGVAANAYAPIAYDAVYVAAKGLADANTTDGDSLLASLYNVTHEGASGDIEFNDLGEVYGRYDYVQLIDQTYESFGGWHAIPTFKTGTLTLSDGSSWLIVNNKITPKHPFTIRDPISISSNTELNTSFPGIGTIDDPVRIEGWNITKSTGTLISISSTTLYFRIANCLLNGMSTPGNGIYLSNVIHGTINNNIVYNNGEAGIQLFSSENNTISRNIAYNNNWDGISLQYSDNNIIERNIVYGNNANGISISNSNNNKISSNTVNNNSPRGIPILNSKSNIFSNNVIFGNAEWGISFEPGADDNIVQFNDFSRNSGGNPPQALDQGINNTFSSNYWSDWTGIGSYAIAGEALNQDLSPLTNPYHLSAPVITAPTSATPTLKDSVTIQWTASNDVFGHSLTYAVFYSIDNGVTWIKIKSGMFTTNYLWDLTSIYDGTTVRIKVQATDSVGFNSFSVSPSTFTIENPLLTSTTTTKPITTTTTTVPTVTPGWNVLFILLYLFVILLFRHRKKKS